MAMTIEVTQTGDPLGDDDDLRRSARVFQVLGEPSRLKILGLLRQRGDTITVEEIVESIGLKQSTISMHLRMLVDADLVLYRKDGMHRYYRMNHDGLRAVQGYIDVLIGKEAM